MGMEVMEKGGIRKGLGGEEKWPDFTIMGEVSGEQPLINLRNR